MDGLKHILIVEDDPALSSILVKLFTAKECITSHSSTVAGALLAYDRARPDAVLLDEMLADGSGADVLKHIRANDVFTPVVMMSARRDIVHERLFQGADNYLTKPQAPETICAYVFAAIDRAESHTFHLNAGTMGGAA